MVLTSNNTSNIIVYNSITNTIKDQKLDTIQPFSFIEFLNYSQSLGSNIVQFNDYQLYLQKWNTVTSVKYSDYNTLVRQEFISFLRSISLNFTTAEEKRFLQNINFQNNSDLEIAVPYFSTKIKQVLLYFANKRDTYSIDLELAKNKGSIYGITNYIKTSIIETIFANDLQPAITTTQPLSTVSNQVQVEVEQGYDTFNNYYDIDPFKPSSFYNATGDRAKFFTSNTNTFDPNLFLDYDQAIIDLINSEKVVLEQLQTLVTDINTPDINLLQSSDFIDYDTRTRENLRLILNAELIKKFIGTDFYYLSATNTGVVSGLLFETQSPFTNLLNVYNPTTLTVPQSSIKFERDVGLFFKPTLLSILQLQTPFSYTLKPEIPKDGAVIFPDPNQYGNIVGLTKTDHYSPFNFTQQGDRIQKNISSNNAFGNSNVSKNDFTFESYHSQEQNSVKSVLEGIYNKGVVTSYGSDVYGNIFIGIKQENTDFIKNFYENIPVNTATFGLSTTTFIPYLSSIKEILNSGSLPGTYSFSIADNRNDNTNIFKTRNTPGYFVVYNIDKNTITPLSAAFETAILKYTGLEDEINNKLINFEPFINTFVMTTSSYVIIDKMVYINGEFFQSPPLPLITSSTVNNKASNVFLNGNELYIVKVVVTDLPSLSGSNNRSFTTSLQSYNIYLNETTNYTFESINDNNFAYDLATLLNVTNVSLVYNKKQDLYNVVITLKDLNNNLFLHNIFYRISNGVVSLVKQKIFSPTNVNLTINFFDNSYVSSILTQTILTTPTIEQSNGILTF
jgi:hypothetical protein